MPSTNLSLQRIGDFEKARDNSLLVKKCCAKEAYLAQSSCIAKFKSDFPEAISFYYQD